MIEPNPPSGLQKPAESTADGVDEATRAILYEVFPIERFRDRRYLDWFYRANPVGHAIEINRYENGKTIAHIGGIPQRYQRQGREVAAVFPLNIAVSESARGRGLMSKISQECFDATEARFTDGILVGVPNASSTPGYTGRLGFRLVRPLPVVVLPPLWPALTRVRHFRVDYQFLKSATFSELVASIDFEPGPEWSHQWSPALLEWRLSAPHARYALHVSRDLVLVTTTARRSGVPVCVIVKTFARRGARSSHANGVAAAACRFQRTPIALYAGFSNVVRFTGLPFPDRLKPAPLNLIVRNLRPGFLDIDQFEFERFEFFDFDPF